jgi:uncharacterized protein DUF397
MMYRMDNQAAGQRELDTSFMEWRKSSFSNPPDNQCVEVAFSTNAVGVRDSKNPCCASLVFDQKIWPALLDRCRSGALDLPRPR